jgi:hypothetical protein
MPIDKNGILDMPNPVTVGPFWSKSRPRLRMTFKPIAKGLLVHGTDPDTGDSYVFDALLRNEEKDKFIKAVEAGLEPQPVNDNKPLAIGPGGVADDVVVTADTVVITGTDNGDGKGPKRNYQLNLANG